MIDNTADRMVALLRLLKPFERDEALLAMNAEFGAHTYASDRKEIERWVSRSAQQSSDTMSLKLRIELLEQILKSVQSDACNWLHSDLNQKIEMAVGPPGDYRPLDDSGISGGSEHGD